MHGSGCDLTYLHYLLELCLRSSSAATAEQTKHSIARSLCHLRMRWEKLAGGSKLWIQSNVCKKTKRLNNPAFVQTTATPEGFEAKGQDSTRHAVHLVPLTSIDGMRLCISGSGRTPLRLHGSKSGGEGEGEWRSSKIRCEGARSTRSAVQN